MIYETELLVLLSRMSGFKIEDNRKVLDHDWPAAKNITELKLFIELVQIFKTFIMRFSSIYSPITNCPGKTPKFRAGIIILMLRLTNSRSH